MHSNTINNSQNFWCRSKYCQHLNTIHRKIIFKETNGCILKDCKMKASECRGAHDEDSIKILSDIYKYNLMKKEKINWVGLYIDILNIIQKEKSKIHNIEHKQKTNDLTKYNFIELIQLWRDLACYYRKISKSLPSRLDCIESEIIDDYTYKEEVPIFSLSNNNEEIAWPFVRLTKYCHIQQKVNDCINKNILITIWDICLANGVNCKEGVHDNCELLCVSNFLTGRCNCNSLENINKQIIIFEKQIEDLKQIVTDPSWTVKKSKNKTKNDPKSLILSLECKINDLKKSRYIHYTEQEMIPFNKQYETYLEQQKIEELKIIEQQKFEEVPINISIKPVIKLTKFGKK